jgi:hypothetical protein
MFSNYRYPVVLFILSFIGMMVGLMFRIAHLQGARLITGSMTIVQVFSILWLILIIIRGDRH